jgi:hypothetical protein
VSGDSDKIYFINCARFVTFFRIPPQIEKKMGEAYMVIVGVDLRIIWWLRPVLAKTSEEAKAR